MASPEGPEAAGPGDPLRWAQDPGDRYGFLTPAAEWNTAYHGNSYQRLRPIGSAPRMAIAPVRSGMFQGAPRVLVAGPVAPSPGHAVTARVQLASSDDPDAPLHEMPVPSPAHRRRRRRRRMRCVLTPKWPRPPSRARREGEGEPYPGGDKALDAEAGLLVLFPSWLSHSVDRLDDGALDEGERRVAVAFNVHGWERSVGE